MKDMISVNDDVKSQRVSHRAGDQTGWDGADGPERREEAAS